jgi:hypothetical protein
MGTNVRAATLCQECRRRQGSKNKIAAVERHDESASVARSRGLRIAGKVAYWLAVAVVSLALVFALILLLESRDDSSVDSGALGPPRALARV